MSEFIGGGDDAASAWLENLAQRAQRTQWHSHAHSDAMLTSLLSLPRNLLNGVLTTCLCASPLPVLLDSFPLPLRPALISAAATTGTLTIPSRAPANFLCLLGSVTPPTPGLHTLTVADDPAARYPMSTAVLLARALTSHSTLTSLHLDGTFLLPCWLRRLNALLPRGTLPHLADLRISTPLRGISALSATLRRLPSITHLAVAISLPNSASSPPSLPLSHLCDAAVSPASLPNLRTLTYSEASHSAQHEVVPTHGSSAVHLLLPLLSAPALTQLNFTTTAASVSHRAFLAALRRFVALEQVCADSEALDSTHPLAEAPDGPEAGVLCALREVHITSACTAAALQTAAHLCAEARGTLACCCMQHVRANASRHDPHVEREMLSESWGSMLRVLRRCGALDCLELRMLGWPRAIEGEVCSELNRTLARLPSLTHLVLQAKQAGCEAGVPHARRGSGWRSAWMNGKDLGAAVAALTALQVLTVCSGRGRLEVGDTGGLLRGCTQMPRLRFLGLCFHGVDAAEVAQAVPRLNRVTGIELRPEVVARGGPGAGLRRRFPDLAVLQCGPDA